MRREKKFISLYMWTTKNERKEETPEICVGQDEENVDLGELIPLQDQENLACTQRDCKTDRRIVQEHRKLFESLLSAGTAKPVPGWKRSLSDSNSWSYDMEGHAKRCVQRYSELANKRIEQLYKVSTSCPDDNLLIFVKGRTGDNKRNTRSMLAYCTYVLLFDASADQTLHG